MGMDSCNSSKPRLTLFRREAVEARRASLVGDALQARPISYPLLTAGSVAIATAIIGFAFWGEYTRKERVTGYLEPSAGLIKVYAAEAGTLIEKHVTEGQTVRRGDPLFVISTERASSQTPQAQAAAIAQIGERVESLEQARGTEDNLTRVSVRALREELTAMDRELRQLVQALAVQEERTATAERAATRYAELAAGRFVPQIQAEDKRAELLEQQARLHELRRDHAQLDREANALRRQIETTELNAQKRQAELDREILTLTQERTERESRRMLVVTAPADGTVTAILGERGQMANPQAPLLSILPEGAKLQARLLVPSHSIGFIGRGDEVRVRYHAFPYQRFGSFSGAVTEISKTLISPNEIGVSFEIGEAVYRVTVALDAQQIETSESVLPLQAGMRLDADIWLERRRLVEWLFEPLLTVVKKV